MGIHQFYNEWMTGPEEALNTPSFVEFEHAGMRATRFRARAAGGKRWSVDAPLAMVARTKAA
jgi:hypothetical protein